jgi:hypothetical protein
VNIGLRTRDRRRRLVVCPELQRRIVRDITVLPLIVFVLSIAVLAVFTGKLHGEAAAADVELPSLIPWLLCLFGVVVVASFGLLSQAARFSNRVAGPQFRILRVVSQELAKSTGQQIQLRGDDYLREVAADVNALLSRLDELNVALESSSGDVECRERSRETTSLAQP